MFIETREINARIIVKWESFKGTPKLIIFMV